jgi:hypothetical protein
MALIRAAGILALSLLLLGAGTAQALSLEKVGDFDQPTYVASDPVNANRLLVLERKGGIKLVADGTVSSFADFGPTVGCPDECPSERGAMSIALAPDFASSGRLYVDYASNIDGDVHIDEFLSPGPSHSTATFARNLATIDYPDTSLHFGGQLQVGRDGYLYISTGDGGGDNDPFHNGQNPTSLLGKIVRLDPAAALPIPVTVWSLGLRNPFRFSFDRQNGDMVIADVGQGAREEVDFAPAAGPNAVGGQGANYGWNCREGGIAGPGTDPQCATTPLSAFTAPVFEYTTYTPDPDLGGARCSIIGGYVVRDPALGALGGRYLYGDYCSGVLRSLQLPASAGGQASGDCTLGLKVENPVSFGEDAAARLYVVAQDGGVSRLVGPAPSNGCAAPVVAAKKAAASIVGIKAQRRRVQRGKRALLTVWVSPCKGRKSETVGLLRNGHRNGSRFLSRACTANFSRRIGRGTRFAAFTHESDDYLAAKSRQLTIRIAHRQRSKRG